MCGMSKPGQWQIAQALYVVGSLGMYHFPPASTHRPANHDEAANIVTSFYAATFPGLVRDLPQLIKSEQDVKNGEKT